MPAFIEGRELLKKEPLTAYLTIFDVTSTDLSNVLPCGCDFPAYTHKNNLSLADCYKIAKDRYEAIYASDTLLSPDSYSIAVYGREYSFNSRHSEQSNRQLSRICDLLTAQEQQEALRTLKGYNCYKESGSYWHSLFSALASSDFRVQDMHALFFLNALTKDTWNNLHHFLETLQNASTTEKREFLRIHAQDILNACKNKEEVLFTNVLFNEIIRPGLLWRYIPQSAIFSYEISEYKWYSGNKGSSL